MKLLILFFSLIFVLALGQFAIELLEFSNPKNKIKKSKTIIISILLLSLSSFVIAVTLSFSNDFLYNANAVETDYTKVGAYGDLIGGIMNPVISFIGIIAASLAFYMQYKANKQVQEQFEKQEKKDYIQNFENKFFNLINLHHQIISDIDIDCEKIFHHENKLKEFIEENEMVKKTYSSEIVSKEKHTSRDVFKYMFNILDYLLSIDMWIVDDNEYADNNENDIKKFRLIFNENYSIKYRENTRISKFPQIYYTIYSLFNTDLGHYFRNLYSIVKFVDNTKFSEDVVEDYKIKYNYLSILRAQLSDAELYVIFLNCIYYYGNEKFKPLLEKYSFFKIIPINNDDDNIFNVYNKFYNEIAFHPLKKEDSIKSFLDKSEFQKIKINIIEKTEYKL